jgi:hypothetical protein
MRDFSDDLKELRRRLGEAEGYLKIEPNRARLVELEHEVARPDLWDDQDVAKRINTEYANVKGDIDSFDALARELEDVEVLHELAREVDDESQEPDIAEGITSITAKLDQLDLRSLFTGEHDDADCIVQINAKDGGVDAQDWTEMLLRMYTRWAERRGFTIEIDGVSEGAEAGLMSADFTIKGRYAYGLMTSERGTHRLVRISPFDNQGRRQTSFAAVQVWPVMDAPDLEVNESDIRMDVVGGALDPRAHRVDRLVAGGAQPAAEPREGDGPAAHDDRRQDRRGARGRAGQHRRSPGAGRLGQPDPLVRAAAVPDGQGPAHRGGDQQRRRRAGRGHRRVHGGLPAVATPGGTVIALVSLRLRAAWVPLSAGTLR